MEKLAEKIKCPHCEKEYSKKGIGTHIWRNHTEVGIEFTKNHDPNKGYKEGTRQGWSKGLKKETNDSILRTSKTLTSKYADGILIPSMKGKNHSKESIEKISKNGGGCRKGSGRGKKGWYKGYWCDSSWELAFVIYNIERDIYFKRNTEGFKYKFKDKVFNYYPDFIMEDGSYVEIKGYETEKTNAKHNQFPYKLKMLKKEDLIDVFQYVENKYGKDFIKLYE